MTSLTLIDGASIPQLGFGVFQVPAEQTARAVALALEAGYRHIDTAEMYGNEAGVGQAIRASGLARDDIYVTSKLNNGAHGRDAARDAFAQTIDTLDIGYLDLFLIHWPLPTRDRYVESWLTLTELVEEGTLRSAGVSNFQVAHLDRLARESDVVPVLNQIELHPYLVQQELRDYHDAHGIRTEAWSPLARGGTLLTDPVIVEVAQNHGRTPAQVVLSWHLALGNVVIPKSVTPSRVRENYASTQFELDESEIDAITALNRDQRTGPDPDTFDP